MAVHGMDLVPCPRADAAMRPDQFLGFSRGGTKLHFSSHDQTLRAPESTCSKEEATIHLHFDLRSIFLDILENVIDRDQGFWADRHVAEMDFEEA